MAFGINEPLNLQAKKKLIKIIREKKILE